MLAACWSVAKNLSKFRKLQFRSGVLWLVSNILGAAHEKTCFDLDDDLSLVRGSSFARGGPWLARPLARPRYRLRSGCRCARSRARGRRLLRAVRLPGLRL